MPSLFSEGRGAECSDMGANLSLGELACSFLSRFDAILRTVGLGVLHLCETTIIHTGKRCRSLSFEAGWQNCGLDA